MRSSVFNAFGSAVVIALCLTGVVTVLGQSAASEPLVQAGIDAYKQAYEARDLNEIMELFDPGLDEDVVALRRKGFERLFEDKPDSVDFDVAKVVDDGSAASVLLTVRERFPAGERVPDERVQGHLIRFRNLDGAWRISEFADEIRGEAFDPAARTFRSENGRYTLRIPEGWIPVETPLEMTALTPDSFVMVAPDLQSTCMLGFVQLPMKINPEEGVRADMAAEKRLTTEHRFLSEGPRTVGDLEGYEAISEFSTGDDTGNRQRRRRLRLYLEKEPILYFFILDAIPPEKFEGIRAAFDSIIDSFAVLPPEEGRTTAEMVAEHLAEGMVHDRVYTSEEYNCFIAAPEGWEVRTSPNPAHLVEMKYTKGNSIARLLSSKGIAERAVDDGSAETDLLHRVFEKRLDAVKTLVEDFKEVSRKDVTVEGEFPAIQSVQTYTVQGLGKFHIKEVTVMRGGTYYLILCQAVEPDSYAELEPDFDRIIDSFGFVQ